MKRLCPSPSMVVAFVALFVALGGTAVAATVITSAHIKNRTIRLVDMHPSTISALRGRQGPQGVTGAPGTPGGFDPSKVTYVTGPRVAVSSGQIGVATASCPAGTTIIGGGFFSSITDIAASSNGGVSRTTWQIIVNNTSLISVEVWAYAICAAP